MSNAAMPEEASNLMEDVKILLQEMGGDTQSASPLRAAVAMKRLEVAVKMVGDRVVEAASAEFLAAKSNGKKMLFHGGLLSAFTPSCEWHYPPEIELLEQQVKDLKEKAKKDGAARSVSPAAGKRAYKVETPFSGAAYDVYREGAKALAELV